MLLAFAGKANINGKPELSEVVIEKLKRLAPLVGKHDFTPSLETLPNEANHRHIMEGVGSPAVKIYYDPANSVQMDYDIYREIESFRTKTSTRSTSEICDLLCQGEIDFVKVKGLQQSMQYKDWLIIEGSTSKRMNRE